MNDTSPEAAALVRKRFMAMTGEERLLIGVRMHQVARSLVIASFPPGITATEGRALLKQRFYGELSPQKRGEFRKTSGAE